MDFEHSCRKRIAVRGLKKPNSAMNFFLTILSAAIFGFLLGVSFPVISVFKLNAASRITCEFSDTWVQDKSKVIDHGTSPHVVGKNSHQSQNNSDLMKIWAPSNPRGAERLPPKIVVNESDFFLHRLWGEPSEDLTHIPKYLVTFTVGIRQKKNIDAAVKKFSDNFTILLFHYDGKIDEWDEFEWSKKAIHVSARKQTKWWYAKRFLHPSIVAPYDYIFVWDEDLGLEHFDAEEYIRLTKKHGLEISQPGLDPTRFATWQMTKRQEEHEVHKTAEERPGWCIDPLRPPCAAFVEIMAPVFSQNAWKCVWHMIQNDLVHGWGIDLSLQHCAEPAHEKIGVVDAQWIVHQSIPSLGEQGQTQEGRAPWEVVRIRCKKEWVIFQVRMAEAEKSYYKDKGIDSSNFTNHKMFT